MSWIISIGLGGFIGLLGSKFIPRDRSMDVSWDWFAGCVGGIVGNFIAINSGLTTQPHAMTFHGAVSAVLGATIFVVLHDLVHRSRLH